MVAAALLATLAGAPGLIHRRAWPAALVLLPAGAYLVMRPRSPCRRAPTVSAVNSASTWPASGRRPRLLDPHVPAADLAGAIGLKLLLVLIVYTATGLAALAAVGLRRPLAAVVVFLVVLGFSLTVDGAGSVVLRATRRSSSSRAVCSPCLARCSAPGALPPAS